MTSAEQFFTYGVLKTRPDNDITDGLGLPDPTLLGALAVTKGLILGSILGRSRTSSRGGRSYTRYSRTNHYHQTNNYYTHYTQPRTVSVYHYVLRSNFLF